jgi:hypothetical protein
MIKIAHARNRKTKSVLIRGRGIREERAFRSKGNLKENSYIHLYQMERLITGTILPQFSSCYVLRKGQLERPILYVLGRDVYSKALKVR